MELSPSRIAVATFILACSQPVGAAEIAITLDDVPYPVPSRLTPAKGLAIVKAMNQRLDDYRGPPRDLSSEKQLTEDSRPAFRTFG